MAEGSYKRVQEAVDRQADDILEIGEREQLIAEPPSSPRFPIIMVFIALLKDFLDALDLSLIGMVFTVLSSIMIGLVVFLWVLMRLHGSGGAWWKKKIIKKVWIRYGIASALEILPGVHLIPATTIFVLMVFYDETKTVKLLNAALEKIRI